MGIGPKVAHVKPGLQALTLLCGITLLLALYAAFVVAPIEKQMGIVYKILFFHAPAAYLFASESVG